MILLKNKVKSINQWETQKCLQDFKLYWTLTSMVTGGVSISAFASLVDVPVGIVSSAVGNKCAQL